MPFFSHNRLGRNYFRTGLGALLSQAFLLALIAGPFPMQARLVNISTRMVVVVRLFTALLFTILPVASAQAYVLAEIVSPEPGTTLTSSTVTFTWTDLGLWYHPSGRDGRYSGNIFYGSPTRATSQVVSGIPTTTPVYVTLYTSIDQTESGTYYSDEFDYNMDRDSDGINDAIDANPDLYDLRVIVSGPDYTLTVLGSGRVASLQISPTLFDDLANGMNYARMQELTHKVYTRFEDVFDFIFVTFDPHEIAGPHYSGAYFAVKNDTSGIGQGMYNNTVQFGSAGRLQGAIHLNGVGGLQNGPSLHEIMHRWGAYLTAVPSVNYSHWGWSSVGGVLGGWKPGSLEDLGAGQYRAKTPGTDNFGFFGDGGNGGVVYSDLELYIMGLNCTRLGLPDIQIANDFQWVDPNAGTFSASSISNVSMNAVIAADGPRIPDYTASQKNFRALHVIIVKEPLRDSVPWASTTNAIPFQPHWEVMTLISPLFWEATGGRATLRNEEFGKRFEAEPEPEPDLNISTRTRANRGERADRRLHYHGNRPEEGDHPRDRSFSLLLLQRRAWRRHHLRAAYLSGARDCVQRQLAERSGGGRSLRHRCRCTRNDLESAIVRTLAANSRLTRQPCAGEQWDRHWRGGSYRSLIDGRLEGWPTSARGDLSRPATT